MQTPHSWRSRSRSVRSGRFLSVQSDDVDILTCILDVWTDALHDWPADTPDCLAKITPVSQQHKHQHRYNG